MKEVGNTKLSLLKNFLANNFIYIKDESSNPTGSIKDRTVFNMLSHYKKDGILVEGGTIIEATSGNTGISLAYFQKDFNYKAVIVMPTSASLKRREMIAQYGAELVLVDGGMVECNNKVRELLKEIPNSFIFNQFACPYNPEAHLKTAKELDEALDNIDYIFAGFGTGGTVSGIANYFAGKNTKVIAIEPKQSPLITEGFAKSHKIQGIGANFVPKTLNRTNIYEFISVDDEDSIAMAKRINKLGQFNCGISSGAALLGALNYLEMHDIRNKNVIVIFPDKGDRYEW